VIQRSIPVQPGETAVTAALRRLADIAGWAVTSTTNGAHSRTSYHYTRNGARAVDYASLDGPGRDTAQLLEINHAIIRLTPLSMITELIYGGPGNICVKDGRIVDGQRAYGPVVMDRHRDHVHLAVIDSFTYNGGPELPGDDPNLPNLPDIMGFYPVVNTSTGMANGYYILSSDGQLHAFGPGAPYFGRSEVPEG
jgi:hypothetical protein